MCQMLGKKKKPLKILMEAQKTLDNQINHVQKEYFQRDWVT